MLLHVTVMYLITMYQFQGGLMHHFSLISVMIIWWISWARFSINENQLVIFKLCCFFRTVRPAYIKCNWIASLYWEDNKNLMFSCPQDMSVELYILFYQFILQAQYNKKCSWKRIGGQHVCRKLWIFESW